jgi:hypothetical protein
MVCAVPGRRRAGRGSRGFALLEVALPSPLDNRYWIEHGRAPLNGMSDRVVIGMDPHKRSATIEVMTAQEAIVGRGYAAMVGYVNGGRIGCGRSRAVAVACPQTCGSG